jgi:hypothetical protein
MDSTNTNNQRCLESSTSDGIETGYRGIGIHPIMGGWLCAPPQLVTPPFLVGCADDAAYPQSSQAPDMLILQSNHLQALTY